MIIWLGVLFWFFFLWIQLLSSLSLSSSSSFRKFGSFHMRISMFFSFNISQMTFIYYSYFRVCVCVFFPVMVHHHHNHRNEKKKILKWWWSYILMIMMMTVLLVVVADLFKNIVMSLCGCRFFSKNQLFLLLFADLISSL